jgi:hypothetical protein
MPSPENFIRVGREEESFATAPVPGEVRKRIEPWLSAVLQSEHLAVLLGSGFTTAVSAIAGASAPDMSTVTFRAPLAGEVDAAARQSAEKSGRGTANIEDQIRAALQLIAGLEIIGDTRADQWRTELDTVLGGLVSGLLTCERVVRDAATGTGEVAARVRSLPMSFLLTFASRSASRERLQLFTTNYDRLIERGCDLAGLRPLDRFVGGLEPRFRASRLDVDMHYNPPGIRGEPRYLEGVLRLTKLHGSLDWRFEDDALRRVALPFGADDDHPGVPGDPLTHLMIYPNPAKDVETLEYPYAELFRDFAAALCRPNSALVTYGYGFGDDHINRVLADMLSIPSTHMVVISYDWCGGRLERFLEQVGRLAQISLLVGSHFGDLETLVAHYLPKPAIDTITLRQADLLRRREPPASTDPSGSTDISF